MKLYTLLKRCPLFARYILSVYGTGILFFTFFRCLLIYTSRLQLDAVPRVWSVMSRALFMGLRFDIVVSGYLLILPAVVLLIAELTGTLGKRMLLSAHIFSCLVYPICFFICAADIPFFINYNTRLNISILNWVSSPVFIIKMIWQDNSFLSYFVLFLLTSVLFIIIMTKIYRKFIKNIVADRPKISFAEKFTKLLFPVFFLGCMLLGIRGRTDEKSPIVVGTAYFSNYNFPNQVGLNPVFTFIWSWTDGWKDENKPLTLMNDDAARHMVQNMLHVSDNSPGITRNVISNTPEHKYNVVIVIMESMSAYYLHRFGNNSNLTPNIDSLAENGFSFHNFYSAGIHTFNGIFSTLYAFPALMARHTMEGAFIPSYTGLPYLLTQRGYETMYFTTHDDQFDNVGGFLSANNIHTIISKKDYPAHEVKSTLGVADHYMFDFSLPLLTNRFKQQKPFLAVFMTSSNHSPYVLPTDITFAPKHADVRGGCVEYADWAIGHFMQKAAAMPWYDSTIFVFLGDHGTCDGDSYAGMPIWYNHIPCIIYSPMFRTRHKEMYSPGGQIDIFPTIAGLLGGNYTNKTMGIDLLQDKRQWMFFSQDDKVGVADTGDLYVWQKNSQEHMFPIGGQNDIFPGYRKKADSMKDYAFSMIQYAQWLRSNNKTGPGKLTD